MTDTRKDSRDPKELVPAAYDSYLKAMAECKRRGIPVFPTCTHRSGISQHEAFVSGHSQLDSGLSMHEYDVAVDLATDVVIGGKKVLYHKPTLQAAGAVFKSFGWTWGGDFKKDGRPWPDMPHVQFVSLKEQDIIYKLKTREAINKYLLGRK